MVFGYFGQIFYIGLLLTNAVAILSEDRFLAKSESCQPVPPSPRVHFAFHQKLTFVFDSQSAGRQGRHPLSMLVLATPQIAICTIRASEVEAEVVRKELG